ncbi:hypothetical protein NBRC3293_0350 [Gluconobacter oxydans NBRC 3293]|uniref:Uncharacterized protein n=1 Tax=Gluconobacter oxydans NBRC 3293 TaxID=1315969 RepID=A0A829WRT5_GLUOY|nr:hypothetical protein NBRC3293_0350 [Gluconobacter oxydans NBRC 3293]
MIVTGSSPCPLSPNIAAHLLTSGKSFPAWGQATRGFANWKSDAGTAA